MPPTSVDGSGPLRWLTPAATVLLLGACQCGTELPGALRQGGDADVGDSVRLEDDGDGGVSGVDARPILPSDPSCAETQRVLAASPVDIVIAIDQSASMGEEIKGVIDNLNDKLAAILDTSNVDYRVFMIMGDFCIKSPLGAGGGPPACLGSNPPRYYHLPAPVNSSDALTLILWTYDGHYKQPNTCQRVPDPRVRWGDKLRFDSQKVFIVVTDDDPVSFSAERTGCAKNGGWCANHQCPTYADRRADWGGEDFAKELYKLKPLGMFGSPEAPKWIFHSIISVDRQYGPSEPVTALAKVCSANGNTGETSGVEYQKLSIATGGTRFPTCDTDYAPVFAKIAATLTPLACEFDLTATTRGTLDPSSARVSIDPGTGAQPTAVPRDDSKPCDAGADGFQLEQNNTRIVLCGSACAKIRTDPRSKVNIHVGCLTDTYRDPPSGGGCLKTGEICDSRGGGAACCFGLLCGKSGSEREVCRSKIN